MVPALTFLAQLISILEPTLMSKSKVTLVFSVTSMAAARWVRLVMLCRAISMPLVKKTRSLPTSLLNQMCKNAPLKSALLTLVTIRNNLRISGATFLAVARAVNFRKPKISISILIMAMQWLEARLSSTSQELKQMIPHLPT